ncbi:major tail protein [Bacillus infantis]|uniref:major tail protein n=1 Tax=Bacillus infantis TaxID=324767 RepID=UPI003CFB80F9
MSGVKVGLKDLHFAKMIEDGKYEAPVKIAKALTATITPTVNSSTQYADDAASEVVDSMGDVQVELGIDDLSTEKYALLLGKTVKADGVLVDNAEDVAPYGALMFRSLKSNGQYRYVVLYKGRFSIPADSYKTKGDQVEFQEQTLSGKFVPIENGEWRAKVDSDDSNVSQMVIDEWFDYVYGFIPTV